MLSPLSTTVIHELYAILLERYCGLLSYYLNYIDLHFSAQMEWWAIGHRLQKGESHNSDETL